MYYIVVEKDGKSHVVSNMAGQPRQFSKERKARNYIKSRWNEAQIVTEINGVPGRLKVRF